MGTSVVEGQGQAVADTSLPSEPITALLLERHTIAGGQPGQGKSGSVWALMVGAAHGVHEVHRHGELVD